MIKDFIKRVTQKKKKNKKAIGCWMINVHVAYSKHLLSSFDLHNHHHDRIVSNNFLI